VADARAVVGEGHPAAAAVGGGHGVDHADDADHARADGGGGRGAVGVEQGLGVAGGQLEAAEVRIVVAVDPHGDHVEDPGGGLLLQPLAGVAGVDPGPGGKLGRRGRSVGPQRGVEAELEAEVHAEHLH
jgi:hypothetical protein